MESLLGLRRSHSEGEGAGPPSSSLYCGPWCWLKEPVGCDNVEIRNIGILSGSGRYRSLFQT